MKNKFIYELNIDLNIDYLRNLINSYENTDGLPTHHRLVENDEYLTSIRDKYQFLSPIFNVYRFVSGREVPVHIDGDRYCALNIPIENTEKSHTVFYNNKENVIKRYDKTRILYYIDDPVEECFRFTLTTLTLINTTIPHSVTNYGPDTRVIMSWSIIKPYTFEDICLKF